MLWIFKPVFLARTGTEGEEPPITGGKYFSWAAADFPLRPNDDQIPVAAIAATKVRRLLLIEFL
jgi:hypothetical protein